MVDSAGVRRRQPPIADFGFLSDCHSAALVSRDGSIDWWCVPRFDSPSVLGRLLDPEAGFWAIRPAENFQFERHYVGLTGAEVYLEHYKASFGNKWMWSPIVLTPPLVVAGIGGMFSPRWAKTALPVTAALYAANGLLGEYFHARGVSRKPGGWKLYS